MATTVTEIAPDVFRISTLKLTESDLVGRARAAILEGIAGPMPKDMPFTPYTESTLGRLAALRPATLAVMHGSAFRGDGRRALLDLSTVIKELLG